MKMILVSVIALSVLGTTLYQVKTGIDERQDRLRVLEAEISATKRDIAVLEAEWAYLSRPERVTSLSNKYLQMAPISQDRILPLDAIPMRIVPEFSPEDQPTLARIAPTNPAVTGQQPAPNVTTVSLPGELPTSKPMMEVSR